MCGAVADWGQDPTPKLVSRNHTVTVQERLFPQVIEQFAWSHLKARQAAVDPSPYGWLKHTMYSRHVTDWAGH